MANEINQPRSGISALERHSLLTDIWSSPPGWRGLAAVNHSIVGLRFIITGLVFFLIGGVLAMLMRAQLATAESAFLDHETYNQIFTMHGTIMMFLFAVPMIEGLGLYMLPKLLGSRDLAFPRLSAFGYWCFLFGGVILVAALACGVAPNSGWFMYTPLSGDRYNPGINSDVWLLGVTFVEISAIAAGIEFTVTVLKVRTAGMSLRRMPLFGWYILVTSLMIVFGFPPLILGSVLLEIERAFGWPFFDTARGGDPLLWQHLFWLFGHPEVYIIFLPGAAIVSTLIPTFARRPMVGYNWVVASIIATGFISFGLWVHHMFAAGIPYLALLFFSAASMLVSVPTAIQFFAWIATLWLGRPVLRLPMLYLSGFLFIFVAGGLTGVMVALVPFDWQAHDTHFVVAHMHYVLIGGLVFPLLAGVHYWMPLLTGRLPGAILGKWAFWLIFTGFNLTFLIMHLTGLLGMPRRVYTYSEAAGWEPFNLISSIGGFIMAIGFALFLLDILLHSHLGKRCRRNPWGATTLEWAMPHPIPPYNLASQPVVNDERPLQAQPGLPAAIAAGCHLLGVPRNNWRETLAVEAVSGRPAHIILLPGPSWTPLITAAVTGLFMLSFLFKLYWLAAVWALVAFISALRWTWDSGQPLDHDEADAGAGFTLPLHPAAPDPPGWWGMLVGMLANGTFYLMLLFGYFYLWAVAPDWPPPVLLDLSPPWLAAAVLLLATGGAHHALKSNAAGEIKKRNLDLLLVAVCGIIACIMVPLIPVSGLPAPQTHAYVAATCAIAGYIALHALLGALISIYALLRCMAGYVSAQRNLDLRILRLWWLYTLLAGLCGLLSMYGLPLLTGASA